MTRVSRLTTYSNRRRRLAFGLLACIAAVVIAPGCAQQQQQGSDSVVVAQLLLADADRAAVMEVAEDVLVTMRFAIEKADFDAGLLRTIPLSGAQFFELWRSDNAGGFNTAEANLHSLRRTVELQVSEEPSGQTRVVCRVHTERLDIPEQQHITSSGRAYFMFSDSSQSMQKIQLNPEQQEKMAWVDMGRDARLETRILTRIEDALTAQSQSTESGTTAKPKNAGPKS